MFKHLHITSLKVEIKNSIHESKVNINIFTFKYKNSYMNSILTKGRKSSRRGIFTGAEYCIYIMDLLDHISTSSECIGI